ncbi:MAG: ATP synthase F0 subunit C [Desulfobacteraceae bacterium]|nr:ATP synthase F0 subunit C [Desulfobacteraceae bacterium]MBU4002686.1 ATP synthase F0 subunit C [Pseudomonadota bacterium]MBU4053991.1 ATP synthase F0 subunit C [Pseudomonadota bacterium]
MDIQTWVKVAAFTGGGLAMGFGAIGAAIGEGYTAACANTAISRNPELSGSIFKSMLMGQAIAESASIFALVIAMILLFTNFPTHSMLMVSVLLASGLCMGLGAIGSGIGSGFPAGAACEGMARQPGASGRLTTNMLIGSAVAQTPAIFALVTSFILIFTDFSTRPVNPTWAAILGAGLATGFGAIGSGLGGGLVAQASCQGVARQPLAATPVTNVMLLGQAVTQTTAIYGMLVSFILIFKSFPATDALAPSMALLAAGLCMGIGAIGPGIGEGFTARSAVDWISRNESATADLTRIMLVGQAVAESTGIYALVISLVLIFVV